MYVFAGLKVYIICKHVLTGHVVRRVDLGCKMYFRDGKTIDFSDMYVTFL